MAHSAVTDLTYIERIGEHHVECATRKRISLLTGPISRAARLGNHSAPVELLLEQPHIAQLQIAPEYLPDHLRFSRVNDQAPLPQVVTQRYHPTHPHALAPGGGDLVADALSCDLPFELGER